MTTALLLLLAAAPNVSCSGSVDAAFQKVQKAVEARDVAALERLVHPEFQMLHGLGQVEGRAGWLALVSSGRLPRQTAERREWDLVVKLAGSTGLRTSIVRFRDPARKRDMWLRGTATFVCEGAEWRQLWQQSTLLSDGPSADVTDLEAFAGDYAIPGRETVRIIARDGLLELHWATGAVLPLLPLGGDQFASGPTSRVAFTRDGSGRPASLARSGPEGLWWSATRR